MVPVVQQNQLRRACKITNFALHEPPRSTMEIANRLDLLDHTDVASEDELDDDVDEERYDELTRGSHVQSLRR